MNNAESLVRLNGDYCRDVCGQENSCGRLKDGKPCKDSQRYDLLRQYVKTGLTPQEINIMKAKYNQLRESVACDW